MVADIVIDGVLVGRLKQSQASNLMQILTLLVHHSSHVLGCNAVGAQQLLQVVFIESLEWASMVLTVSRCLQINDFGTVPGLIVIALAFLTVHVSNVVSVVLLELVRVHLPAELLLPELRGLFHGQAETLQEQAHLQTTIVLQVVLVSQSEQQSLHARRE